MCRNCSPPDWSVEFWPSQIITEAGNRAWKRLRTIANRLHPGHLMQKQLKYFRKMLPNAGEDEVVYVDTHTVVWHRDLVAAKCILYKGKWTSIF